MKSTASEPGLIDQWVDLLLGRPEVNSLEDNTLLDLHNSSDDTKAEFNDCFIIHLK